MKNSVLLTAPLKTMIPIIKMVGDFCNLRCKYCFYNLRDQSTPRVMNGELLERFLMQYMELFSGHLSFIWHGGEPLLAGLQFFERVVELQRQNLKNGQIIQNAVQTNATLITDEWAEFFNVNDFRVGVSLDGDEESHDRFRIDKRGEGSYKQTMQGINILRQHGIEPGIVQTLTHDNVNCVEKDFRFFVEILGTKSWGINHNLDVQGTYGAMSNHTVTNEELTLYLKACVDSWLVQNNPEIQIREIENLIAGAAGKQARTCTFNGTCSGYFCLEYDGKIYPCDRFSHQQELLFGDLSQQSLLEILNGPTRLQYAEAVNTLHPDCVSCEWLGACHGGCSHHRVGGILGKYYYCETRKTIFAYLKEKIEEYQQERG